MILEEATKEAYGYWPKDIMRDSPRLIITLCEFCNDVRVVYRFMYRTFNCLSCDFINKRDNVQINPMFGKHHTDEAKAKSSTSHKGRTHTDEAKANISAAMKGDKHYNLGKLLSEETKAKQSKSHKLLWEDPVFIARMLKAQQVSLNELERKMFSILEHLAPGEWVFNGDFSAGVSIGRKIPDFVSVGGEKIVIEVFGAYFHDQMKNKNVKNKKTYLETIKHYKRYEYKCIILWEEDVREAFVKSF